jgi:NAD(P)H-flavin reductase
MQAQRLREHFSLRERKERMMEQGIKVRSRSDLGGGLTELVFSVSDEHRVSYRKIGQYTKVSLGAESAYFFLAGNPGAPEWTLVVRLKGAVAEALGSLALNTTVTATLAQGDGFAWHEAEALPLAVLLVGSGFGAALPVLRQRIREGVANRTHVYLGVSDPSDPPAPAFLEEVTRAGIQLTLCALDVANPQEVHSAFPWVTERMELVFETKLHESLAPWAALAVGPKGLVTAIQALQSRHRERLLHVLTNA